MRTFQIAIAAFTLLLTFQQSHADNREESEPAEQPIAIPQASPQAPPVPAKEERIKYFSVGFQFSTADKLDLEYRGTVNNSSVSGSVRESTDSALTLLIETGLKRKDDLGVSASLSYDTKRGDGDGDDFTLFVTGLNLTYSHKSVFLFFGPNYTYMDYSPKLSAGQKYEVEGTLGYQLGFDYEFSEGLSAGMVWRKAAVKMLNESSTYDLRYNGKIEGFQFGIKQRLW